MQSVKDIDVHEAGSPACTYTLVAAYAAYPSPPRELFLLLPPFWPLPGATFCEAAPPHASAPLVFSQAMKGGRLLKTCT